MTMMISFTTIGFPEEGRFRIPSLIVEVVFLILAVMLWLSTGKPHKGPETVLDAEGFQIAPGTRYERVFLWEEQPHVVGGSRWSGHMLVGSLRRPRRPPGARAHQRLHSGVHPAPAGDRLLLRQSRTARGTRTGVGLDRVRALVSFT